MTGSWNDLTNPEGDGNMFILDDFQEAIGEANLINGFDLNTADEGEIETSKETLLDQKESARGFSTNSVQNLVSGAAFIHQAWNGDIVNVRNQVDDPENYRYETCSEGVPVGSDVMSIPINARSPGTAMLFMNWMLEPENAARNVNWNGYPATRRGRTAGVREARQGGAVDRRQPRRARQRRGVSPRRPRRPPAVDDNVHGGEGGLMAAGFWDRFLVAPGPLVACCCSRCRSAWCWRCRSATWTTSGARSTSNELSNYKDAFDPVYLPVLLRSVGFAAATAAICLAIGYPIAYYIARFGGRWRYVLDRGPGGPVLRQLPGPHLRLGRAALRRGSSQQRR